MIRNRIAEDIGSAPRIQRKKNVAWRLMYGDRSRPAHVPLVQVEAVSSVGRRDLFSGLLIYEIGWVPLESNSRYFAITIRRKALRRTRWNP
jgi:hypothetical protein